MVTKSKIMAALIRNLPFFRMEKDALVNAIFPENFDQIAEEIAGTPATYKTIRVDFIYLGSFGKTSVYDVRDKKAKVLMGNVRWHVAYYGYAFFPEPCTIYDTVQLTEIINFIETLMFLHRDKKKTNE